MNLSSVRLLTAQPIASGTLELLKWLAVILMTVDHINLHLLESGYPVMFAMGRMAMPLFVFVLAYNLAQPRAMEAGAALRVLERLLPFALLSSLPYMELNIALFGWLPLNVLFTLAAGTAFVVLVERPTIRRQVLAIALYAGAGFVVDYGWTGIGLFVSCWYFFRKPSYFWMASVAIFLLLLADTNTNHWALAVFPVIGLASLLRLDFPRLRGALYYYYPLHLVVIAVLQITLFDH